MSRSLIFIYVFQVVAGFIWPSYRVWKRTRRNPYVLSKDDGVEGVVANWFRTVLVLVGIFCALPWLDPKFLNGMGINTEMVMMRRFGFGLLGASLILMFVAQWTMRDSWRIGLDHRMESPLVTRGIFAFSRNPVFLAMRVQVLGVALVLPGAASFLLVLLNEIPMQIQVRLEEEFLAARHGERYIDYRLKVRRWI